MFDRLVFGRNKCVVPYDEVNVCKKNVMVSPFWSALYYNIRCAFHSNSRCRTKMTESIGKA